MADGDSDSELGSIGLGVRERGLLGLLLALLATAMLLGAAANARMVSGYRSNEGVLTLGGGWSNGGLRASLDAFVMGQTPSQALLLVGAVVLAGQGGWAACGVAARLARVLVLVVGSVVGVASGWAAVVAIRGSSPVWSIDGPFDLRASGALTFLAIGATALVAARLAFGLLPVGGSDGAAGGSVHAGGGPNGPDGPGNPSDPPAPD